MPYYTNAGLQLVCFTRINSFVFLPGEILAFIIRKMSPKLVKILNVSSNHRKYNSQLFDQYFFAGKF